MTNRKAAKIRLNKAGFTHVDDWLPNAVAKDFTELAEVWRDRVERIKAEPVGSVGRPPKEAKPDE